MKAHILFACLLVGCISSAAASSIDRDLIGWSERNDAKLHVDSDENSEPRLERERGSKVLSWDPRIVQYTKLLTEEECDHLVNTALPRLSRSGVVGEGGSDEVSDVRTSDGMFFGRGEDEVITRIENKISEWTLIPPGHGEGLQLLRYNHDQKYGAHYDYLFDEQGTANGGNRLATVLVYLSDVEEGGETVFPNVPVPSTQTAEAGFSKCAMEGLAVRPRKGDAVLFWSLKTDGRLDRGSLHGGCPVLKGTKFAVTKWYHVAHYAMGGGETAQRVEHVVFVPPPPPAPPGCENKHTECNGWAEGGECENNPEYMIGTVEQPGECILSCGRCDLMPKTPGKQGRKEKGGA